MLLAEKKWREHEQSVIKYWTKKLENFNFSSSAANSIHAEHYIKEAGIQTLINLDLSYKSNWVKSRIENNELIDIGEFPSLQVMLYSQYYRIFDPYWKKRPQEVTDIQIISPSPYMDIVITEKFQAEILKKIRNRITGLNNSRIWTLKDIRN